MVSIPEDTRRTHADLKRRAAAHLQTVERLRKELDGAEDEYQRYARAAGALEVAFPGLAEPEADIVATNDAGNVVLHADVKTTMTGRDAAYEWLRRFPDRWFLISDVIPNLIDAGLLQGTYEENENRVRVGMIRLAQRGVLETKKGPGRAHYYKIKEKGAA